MKKGLSLLLALLLIFTALPMQSFAGSLLLPEEEKKEETETEKKENDLFYDVDGVRFIKNPAGGSFTEKIISDFGYDSVRVETTGAITGKVGTGDPLKQNVEGLTYTVYSKTDDLPVAGGTSLTYAAASALAKKLCDETKTQSYDFRCDKYVYTVTITVPANYGVSYISGTYKIVAEKDGETYESEEKTVVSDVSIFEYEYLKWSANEGFMPVLDKEARGYSDYLTAKFGYSDPTNDHYDPIPADFPTVISSTGFRAIAGKKLDLYCGDNVIIKIPEISSAQRGVNFIFKNSAATDSNKKVTAYNLNFFGKQLVQSDFKIIWDLGCDYFVLRESFGIKLEELDVITYYVTKDGKYFSEFTVDYMTADYGEEVILEFENKAGSTLGNYSITPQKPADAPANTPENEINPNTGAPAPLFWWVNDFLTWGGMLFAGR